jgi:hypothetical protein
MTSTSSLKRKRNIVEEPVEKHESWEFTNTESRVDKKIAFKRNTLFQELQTKEFHVMFQDDPSTELSKGIYKNISKFGIHWVATRTLVLPCSDVIEWITQTIDHERTTILNFEDNEVAIYQAPILNQLYHFK